MGSFLGIVLGEGTALGELSCALRPRSCSEPLSAASGSCARCSPGKAALLPSCWRLGHCRDRSLPAWKFPPQSSELGPALPWSLVGASGAHKGRHSTGTANKGSCQDTKGMRMPGFPKNLSLALSLKGLLPEMGFFARNGQLSVSTAGWFEGWLLGYFKRAHSSLMNSSLPGSLPVPGAPRSSAVLSKVRKEGWEAAAGAAGAAQPSDAVPVGCREGLGLEQAAGQGNSCGNAALQGLPEREQQH